MTLQQRVFISYKSEYREIAIRVRDTLQSWGYATWFDGDNIRDQLWRDAIQQGLEASDVVVGISTPEALESREVLSEWNYAYSRQDKRLLLLDYRTATIPYWLEIVQRFDIRTDMERGLSSLKEALQRDSDHTTASRPAPSEITRHQTSTTNIVYNQDALTDDNRSKMLFNMHNAWIKGALYENLPQGATDLKLSVQPEAVLRHEQYGEYTLPDSSRDIGDIFRKVSGQLLILGDPGSGKTILLLQLAEKLIAQAQQDESQPMPAVFNLSSWGRNKPPFGEWLIGELKLAYGVPKKIGQDWIDNSRLTLLLDGLDEIAPSSAFMPGTKSDTLEDHAIKLRSACIDAINQFQSDYPKVDIVVCSRIKDYDALTTKLDLNSAILLNELTDKQIQDFLADGDTQGIIDLLANDDTAEQMAHSPFLLTLMKEAYNAIPYQDTPFNQLKLGDPNEFNRRDHLLEKYANHYIHPDETGKYSVKNIQHWLSWLAWQMVEQKTSVFYVEDLQRNWTTRQSRYYILVGLLVMFLFGFFFGLLFGLLVGPIVGPIVGLLFGLILGLLLGPILGLENIEFAETISFSWHSMLRRDRLIVVVIGGLLVLLLVLLLGGLNVVVISGLIVVLIVALLVVLLSRLNTTASLDLRLKPNTGFFLSLKNSLIVGLLVGLLFALLFVLLFGLPGGLTGGLLFGLLVGLLVGGGAPVIQHIVLRWVLAGENVTPRWRYDQFLDHCTHLGLLRKVGGGYIFRHRLLLEYFAEQFEKNNPEHVQKLVEKNRKHNNSNS